MRNLVSQAQIKAARENAQQALNAAYAPLESVKDAKVCWEGRMARAVEKADELISAGKKTKEEMNAIINDFGKQYELAVAAAHAAVNEYALICKQGGIEAQVLIRPLCPCQTCAQRVRRQTMEEYYRAVATCTEKGFDDESVSHAKTWAAKCRDMGITLKLEEYIL